MGKSLINLSWSDFSPFFEAEGFPVSSVVDFDLALEHYQEHAKVYEDWISRGQQGAMKYLERGLDRRLNPKLVFSELKSVITVLSPYSSTPVGTEKIRYARYLNGPDYHEDMKARLERVLQKIALANLLPEHFESKICIDTSAVLERTWAALSGLGWIGKNTLLIHPKLGSYVFIGVIYTNAIFGESPKILKDYCGPCTRCLTACPTEAITPHELNANKCISYLTLEKRGEWDLPQTLKGFVAGCDLCQEACPYNSKVVRSEHAHEVAPYLQTDETILIEENEETYLARVKGTALSRIKFADFKRNLEKVLNPHGVRKQ